ncbi:hypothetical protein AB8O64_27560 [Streptomyces sp. QH1-20]|uniref:hypothetical protein n=1 Tax=Streptomyces sp. QH1-20 TaxID=3240934 RepID=UPI0035144CB6
MRTRKSLVLAMAAVALGSGLAVATPAAQAEPSSKPAVQASWVLIWGPVSHAPTKYWATADYVPRSKVLGSNARCWGGEDGTDLRIDVVRTSDKKVVKKGGWGRCNGGWMNINMSDARPGTSYYMRIYLRGKAHTIEARAFHKI